MIVSLLFTSFACSKKTEAPQVVQPTLKSDGKYVVMTYNIRYDAPDP
ncbi:hypothetical protein [Olivibacter sitiensis]|nr:hypothetical protein [Olivibacter sitiensis]